MRVALVTMRTTHLRDTAGARRFERIARSLAAAGHDVTVFCAQWWEGEGTTRDIDGVTYRGVTFGPAIASFCTRLPALLASHRPDVVHVRPTPPQQVPAASTGATLARAPLFAEWYGDEGLDPDAWLTRRAARSPSTVITPSELVRTTVRELGASGEAVRTIPDSIDFDLIQRVEPAEEVDVAFAHPLDESANVDSLLLGLAELRSKGWEARIIGDGPQREAAETQASDLRIDDRVTFLGECDLERRLAVYRGAHVFVQTASREYFARELLWAMACGCVGIVEYRAESAAHELIEGYERSFRVTNPQQLAEAIVEAGNFERLTSDDYWARYGDDAIRQRYEDCYRDAIGDGGLV